MLSISISQKEHKINELQLIFSLSLQEFNGRVYATGNPQACFELGTGQTEISLRIPIGTQCGSVQSVSLQSSVLTVVGREISQHVLSPGSRPIRQPRGHPG